MDLKKLIAGKLRAAARDAPARPAPAAGRVPPGQRAVTHFPVLDLGTRPRIATADYRLQVDGLVERPVALSWSALLAFGVVAVPSDFHCVTRWSRLDTAWSGVRVRELLAQARPAPSATHVMAHSAEGYSANVPLARLLADDVLIATALDGRPIPVEHGGPARLVVPSLYAWKSVKWLTRLELMAGDRPGFWEQRGYHNDGDPWREQRFA
ncbi:MAG: sulfite oxidase-like oxidoreductase [Pseudomonadota bacterium]